VEVGALRLVVLDAGSTLLGDDFGAFSLGPAVAYLEQHRAKRGGHAGVPVLARGTGHGQEVDRTVARHDLGHAEVVGAEDRAALVAFTVPFRAGTSEDRAGGVLRPKAVEVVGAGRHGTRHPGATGSVV